MKKTIFKFITVVVVISLCTASVFASNAPTPIYSNDSVLFESSYDLPGEVSIIDDLNYSFDDSTILYFLIDDVLYASAPLSVDGSFIYGDVDAFINFGTTVSTFAFLVVSNGAKAFVLPDGNCPKDPHPHSIVIYDEDPFYEAPPSGDSSQDFMNSLNDGTLEDAGDILDSSLDELPDLSQFSNFSSFLSAALAWVPAGWWFVYRLCFVMLMARVVMVFLWR